LAPSFRAATGLLLAICGLSANIAHGQAGDVSASGADASVMDLFGLFVVPGNFNATATYATRYVSRGFDLNDGRPTPQIFVEFDHPLGLYVNVFATRTRYFNLGAELDYNTGYRATDGNFSYDIGFYYYSYPGSPHDLHVNYRELGAKFAWNLGWVAPSLEAYVSDDYFFGAGKSIFVNAGPDVPLPLDLTLSARLGYLGVEDNTKFIYPDYVTWTFALARKIADFDVALQYTNTTIERSQCLGQNVCGDKFLVRVSKPF
jgi:uncharacterized protein (TIGR02001 family)